jgi:apolipoprotein D and lipocalin family protein
MTWANYRALERDPQYRWAVVGGPSRKCLWIRARDLRMSHAQYDAIVARAARRDACCVQRS